MPRFPIQDVIALEASLRYPVITIVILQFLSCSSTVKAETAATTRGQFDGQKAYEHLVQQCAFGPRLPGSQGHSLTREYIRQHLEENGFRVGVQEFSARSPILDKEVPGYNLYGTRGAGTAKYLFSAHYDTRPYADQDPDPAKRREPVPGANDGASGVAVLLEIARVVHEAKMEQPVHLVFFDLEDHGLPADANGFCLGSRFMANHLPPGLDFTAGINLDMVGDADLELPMEGYSLAKKPKLVGDVWAVGNRLFPAVWRQEKGPSIYDDHMPFLGKGHAYIDVIDFTYPAWHTTSDTADKCSPHSLAAVGVTMIALMQN